MEKNPKMNCDCCGKPAGHPIIVETFCEDCAKDLEIEFAYCIFRKSKEKSEEIKKNKEKSEWSQKDSNIIKKP